MRQALLPLVENARRHARSTVRLELSSDAGRVRLAVRDDGPGLDPRLSERAFEPGVRVDDEPNGGSGLGLPLARRLARSCGGDVVTGPGPGGCFVLELPPLGPAIRARDDPGCGLDARASVSGGTDARQRRIPVWPIE